MSATATVYGDNYKYTKYAVSDADMWYDQFCDFADYIALNFYCGMGEGGCTASNISHFYMDVEGNDVINGTYSVLTGKIAKAMFDSLTHSDAVLNDDSNDDWVIKSTKNYQVMALYQLVTGDAVAFVG